MRHEAEADDAVCIGMRYFLRFSVTLQSCLLFLRNEVVIQGGCLALLVVDRLETDVFSEPYKPVHDPGALSELF